MAVQIGLDSMSNARYTDEEAIAPDHDPDIEHYHDASESEDSSTLLPPSTSDSRSDSRSRKTWTGRAKARVPPRIRSCWIATVTWIKGPNPPRIFAITPIFPAIQHAPLDLLDRFAPKKVHKVLLLIAFYFAWALAFGLILWRSSFASDVPGYGAPVRLWCGATFW